MPSSIRDISLFSQALQMCALVYHSCVRNIRKSHRSPILAIISNLLQTLIFVIVFYVMFEFLGLRGTALRGDFLIYIMTGVFLFLTHVKSLSAVLGSEGPASPIMQHGPMSTAILIAAGMLSTLYVQITSALVVLIFYDFAFNPGILKTIDDPMGALGMLLLSWFTGGGVGLIFLAAKPWFPMLVNILSSVYQRANMIASGKLIVANALPAHIIVLFDWNPLFHVIDQCRGYAFINYTPRHTSWEYALKVGICLVALGLMCEFMTRKGASRSWTARQ
ncbi:MAG: ABC transporter permease [Pseudoprimorskyibacter sp.]|nr:ABC transporter permease [Pseudoprimorskyibacter sp.]